VSKKIKEKNDGKEKGGYVGKEGNSVGEEEEEIMWTEVGGLRKE
jgi:hypothetical protein